MKIFTKLSGLWAAILATVLVTISGVAAVAQDGLQGLERIGKPVSGKLGFQPAGTELARDVQWLDGMVMIIISVIVAMVVLLLVAVAVRYNKRMHPKPATFTHNSPLEIVWTLGPIVILVFIGAFSLPVLFKQQEIPTADLTIKVTGNQWFWTYEYVDQGFEFDSLLLEKDELATHGYTPDEYLLATDNAVVVPVGATVVVNVTGSDVIHSWAVPAFAVKQDGVPGRVASLWFKVEKEGIYFGQCSELCGKGHAYMPITLKAVSQQAYENWLTRAKKEFATNDLAPRAVQVASND